MREKMVASHGAFAANGPIVVACAAWNQHPHVPWLPFLAEKLPRRLVELESPELQREWLPRLASDTLGSFCLSEAGSGSDAFALRCAARRDGDDYLLSGEKLWISNSAEAGVFLVMANAAPEKGHRGITCFVVPREAAGLRVGPKEDKLGTRASSRRRLLP